MTASVLAATAILDNVPKQCIVRFTDGEELQEQIKSSPFDSRHCSIVLIRCQGQVRSRASDGYMLISGSESKNRNIKEFFGVVLG